MLLFEDYNFAFLHINKTGGTSIKAFLEIVIPQEPVLVGLNNRGGIPTTHEHITKKVERLEIMGVNYRDLKILTIIRNPYKRWVSLYYARRRPISRPPNAIRKAALTMSFEEWLSEFVLKTYQQIRRATFGPEVDYLFMTSSLVLEPYIPSNLYIIRLEDLNIALPKFLKNELGVETDVEIPHKNVSNYLRDKDTMDYYPDHLKRQVYQLDKYIIDKYYPEFRYEI